MKLGIVARAEMSRGLGIQSWEACEHLDPAKVLIVDVGAHEQFPIHPERFKRTTIVKMRPDGTLPGTEVRSWLHGLDVVLGFETLYDWGMCVWARDKGVRTVVQLNPEFYRHGVLELPHPDGWWNPTVWRMEQLPPLTRHVPVPVALERFRTRMESHTPPRVLHTVGKPALGDRNGTEPFLRACVLMGDKIDATIRTLWPLDGHPRHVTVEVGGVDDYWHAYDGFDVLVLPRRYGGLCLPAQEAMAAGLAVVMPAVTPNMECWPVEPVRATVTGRVPLPAGWVAPADTDPRDLVDVLTGLLADPQRLRERREASRAWAETHSWRALTPAYMEELQRVRDYPMAPPPLSRDFDPFAPSH